MEFGPRATWYGHAFCAAAAPHQAFATPDIFAAYCRIAQKEPLWDPGRETLQGKRKRATEF